MSLFNFVKSKLSILDVVSDYVQLKQAGNYWKGPCPIHYEKEASFTVSPDKQIFYCFGCHAGGDLIAFIAIKENLSQIEATKYLIDKYQISVPQDIEKGAFSSAQSKKNHFELCKLVSSWMNKKLKGNFSAKEYLGKRNIDSKLVDYFNIGYFPGGLRNINLFIKDMASSNFLVKDLLEAGILIEGRSILYSPFEERIVFPISDSIGRNCAFGGRIFKVGDKRAKYYNSKESLWFSKGKLLFGLDLAKQYIQKERSVFLVEGYTDCVAMVKHGYPNTVATLGTACTHDHLKMLSRYADLVYVLYDGDKAGQKAILRLTQLCWDVNLDLRIIKLNEGDDPESFLSQNGDLPEKIANATDIFSFFIDKVGANFKEKFLSEKMLVAGKILELIAKISDPLKKEILLLEASNSLQIPVASLRNLVLEQAIKPEKTFDTGLVSNSTQNKDFSKVKAGSDKLDTESPRVPLLEERIFSAIINGIGASDVKLHVETDLRRYFSDHIQFLLQSLDDCLAEMEDQSKAFDYFLSKLKETDKAWVIQCSLKFDQKITTDTFEELIFHFCKLHWKKIVVDLKEKLANAKKCNDTERLEHLFNLFVRLKKGIMARGLI